MEFHQFVTRRLQQFVDAPRMWGSEEAVELQALQLLELEVLHYEPAALEKYPRVIMDAYTQELSRRFGTGALPFFMRDPKPEDPELALYDILQKVRHEVGAKLSLNVPPYVAPEGVAQTSAPQ